ncbi:MAG: hypothetical protein LUD48_06345 [Prevotella sp.]|nr:hypothetical protein [Prevotella sp.]
MDKKFQDRIDEYLLHGDMMSDEDKAQFLLEIEQDKDKKEQFELTKNVKEAITSRVVKLEAMETFQQQYDNEHRVAAIGNRRASSHGRRWPWISGIAAIVVIGFFAISLYFMKGRVSVPQSAPTERMRGDDEIFEGSAPAVTDTLNNDTISDTKPTEQSHD